MPSTACTPECTCGKHRRTPKSIEHRQKIAQALRGRTHSDDHRRKNSEAKMGTHRGKPAKKRFLDKNGYIMNTGRQEHPLSKPDGVLAEHREVLYAKIGPGIHDCSYCGKKISWKPVEGELMLCVDHLDNNPANNAPQNLTPSCSPCNWQRGRWPKS